MCGPTCCCDACWHAHPRHVPGGHGFMTGYHSEYMGGEYYAELADEAEMGRELDWRYFREPQLAGPRYITTAVRQLAERADRAAASDRPGKWTWHK